MYLSFKNFAGDFFYVVSFYNPQTTYVKVFSVTVLHGISSRKTTIFNSYRQCWGLQNSNKKHAKKLLPVLELACVVYQTFLIGTAHTDNWWTELPESVIVEKPWFITLAKISYAAEIVLCTKQWQSTQHSRKLHVYLRLHSFEVLCRGTWHMPYLLWSIAPATAGSVNVSACEICQCGTLRLRGACRRQVQWSVVQYSFYAKTMGAKITHNFYISQNFTFHCPWLLQQPIYLWQN